MAIMEGNSAISSSRVEPFINNDVPTEESESRPHGDGYEVILGD